ncbi:uridine diphosphate-N-acetylglucosamine-binding protein YvcK [Frankia sp. Cas4]|uniref:gluconeogenesis factor YvcK family protein n=1 Tax=Frankia sp. Cas4 TaxID=3073927 RepID=UPI002AD4AEC8|nr:uridine diphosphate-N-acetylglucosamine-binding protein YvcK [Frankia sp. Cas4]
MTGTGPAVVAFGGGHGLAASLRALRRITRHLTAVVTVGDDGGSSGRLRTELGALPMGDLRMALAALAGTDSWSTTWAELFQHRFGGGGPLAGHAVGNLVLSALAERQSSAVDALDLAARLLGAAGRVLPLSDTGIDIVAEVAGLDPRQPAAVVEVRGQAAVATTSGRVRSLRLEPVTPAACRPALEAVERAEWVVFGPGSLYTSVLPHLLVPEMTGCLLRSPARRVMVLNLAPQPGETAGYPPEAHLRVIETHAPGLLFDVVIADRDAVGEPGVLARAAADLGARLYLVPVAYPGEPHHDPRRLAVAFEAVFANMAGNGAGNVTGLRPGARSGPATGATGVSDDAARRDAVRRDAVRRNAATAGSAGSAREGVFPAHEGAVSAHEGEE